MKPKLLVIAITFLLSISNSTFANNKSFFNSFFEIEQSSEESQLANKEKENKKRNQDAVDMLNDLINNLKDDNETEKAKALKVMRDYIKKNLEKDPGTVIDEAADEAKKTAESKDNIKKLKDYIDKIHSTVIKNILDLNFFATGKNSTTGHVADLFFTNNSDHFISIHPELVYVNADHKYQGYIIFIPVYVTIGPGGKVVIPLYGYCANPHVPPVPLGENLPPPSQWIPVNKYPTGGFNLDGNPPMIPEPMNPPGGSSGPPQHTINIYVSDIPTQPSFDPGMISAISSSPGFTEEEDGSEDPEIQITWPGSQQEMGGSFDPEKDPTAFAQIAIEALTRIISEVDSIQSSGIYITPFSNDKEKEKEAIIQQAFWIFVAYLMGEEYEYEDFINNIYQQFSSATGKSVTTLPPKQKEQVDDGGVAFWTVYAAVGVKAKVFSEETPSVPISNPEHTPSVPISNPEEGPVAKEKEEDCCTSMSSCYFNPPLDFDMKIADQWGDAEERKKIIRESRKSLERNIDITEEEAFDEYDISKNPTSAVAFWKPGVVGGFAAAHAKTWVKKSDGSSKFIWGTNELDVNAEGTMNCSLSYDTEEDCKAVVAGTALIRINASSSAFDAMAGNRHDEDDEDQLGFLRTTKYCAEKALEWLILKGGGKTDKSFQDHVRDDLQEKVQGEIDSAVEAEVQKLANENMSEFLNALGLSSEDLSLDNLELPDIEESLEELLGIDIPTFGDLEETISEGIEASLNLFFVANTYARANGNLTVQVGRNKGSVKARTAVHYGRQEAEKTSDAMSWTGADCQEKIISDVQPNGLSIKTTGYAHLVSEAVSKFGFGNGLAKAYLESMNLQMLAGLCIYEENETTKFTIDVVGNMSWFANSDTHQKQMKGAIESLENEIQSELVKEVGDFQKTSGNSSLENFTGEMLKKSLDEKIKKWAADHPFYWRNCNE